MRPLIFLPNTDERRQTFESVGLSEIAAGVDQVPSTGPEGKSGFMCGWSTPQDRDIRYDAEQQTWIPASGHGGAPGRYWVGYRNGSPPTERELLRPDHRRGSFIELGDGNHWCITRPADLKRFPVPQPDGSLKWAVDETYNAISNQLDHIKATRVVIDGESSSFVFDDAEDFWLLCDILQLNYRVVPELVASLQLFSDQAIREVVPALLGMKLEG